MIDLYKQEQHILQQELQVTSDLQRVESNEWKVKTHFLRYLKENFFLFFFFSIRLLRMVRISISLKDGEEMLIHA